MEPVGIDILPAMYPIHAAKLSEEWRDPNLVSHEGSWVLRRGFDAVTTIATGPILYHVFSDRAQTLEGDRPALLLSPTQQRFFAGAPSYLKQYRRSPEELPRLQELARQIVGPQPDSAAPRRRSMEAALQMFDDQLKAAERLEAFFRDSETFTYSLKQSVQDATLDPVEDFLFNRKTGHCEYYASALALMLRAVDIPSRVINGFKGGQINPATGFLEVQQRHAHSWVEALIGNRWIILDPTPAAGRSISVASMGNKVPLRQKLSDWLSTLWAQHVLGMSLTQQKSTLYDPFRNAAIFVWYSMTDRNSGLRSFLSSPRRWISWEGGLAAFVLLTFLAGFVWIARRIWKFAMKLWAHARKERFHHRAEFYVRFQRIAAQHGFQRQDAQTPREFAERVQWELGPRLVRLELSELGSKIVEAFYRVRFGSQALDESQLDELDSLLSKLESGLATSK